MKGTDTTTCVSRRGMTLVEVILAISILSLGLTAMLTGVTQCVAAMKKLRIYQEAYWTYTRGELDHPIDRTKEYEEWAVAAEEYPNGYTFERLVEYDEFAEESEDDGLVVIRCRITWPSRGDVHAEEFVRYEYHPEAKAD